jgi:hypothetical protein
MISVIVFSTLNEKNLCLTGFVTAPICLLAANTLDAE